MVVRIPNVGRCSKCNAYVIQGKEGWRERLCVPKALGELYACGNGENHEGPH